MNNWENNAIQFPRLIAEINANVKFTDKQWTYLEKSMDLSRYEIAELFDRASDEWEKIKSKI